MADKNLLPKRPENDNLPMIDQRDKDCLSYTVAFGVPNQRAYGYFHPEFCDSNGKLTDLGRKQSAQFFSYAKHREYCDAYRETLQKFLSGDKEKSETHLIEVDESRKDKALKSLLNQAMSMVESGDTLDPDTLKVLTEIFKKLGILKDDVVEQEAPRRYLPARCRTECAYRLFVESHIENGDIISECDYCRTRKFAEENGWHFDPTKNLDLPEESTNQNN